MRRAFFRGQRHKEPCDDTSLATLAKIADQTLEKGEGSA
jgi:hypothetical protein